MAIRSLLSPPPSDGKGRWAARRDGGHLGQAGCALLFLQSRVWQEGPMLEPWRRARCPNGRTNPVDCVQPAGLDSTHAYTPWWFSHLGARGVPAPSGYRSPVGANAWQNCAANAELGISGIMRSTE